MSHVNRTPVVRTPDPLQSSRRRALRRLGSLRAMGLGAIGDIGSHSFGSVDKITWEGASEWDDANEEEGVVHENTSDTDYDDDAVIQKGFPTDNPLRGDDLYAFYPLHENSGGTAYDLSGNDRDGNVDGANQGVTGVLDTTAYEFNGGSDDVDLGFRFDAPATFAFATQVYSFDKRPIVSGYEGDANNRWDIQAGRNDDNDIMFVEHESKSEIKTPDNLDTDTWYFVTVVHTGSEIRIYLDGTEEDSGSAEEDLDAGRDWHIGDGDGDNYQGRVANLLIYDTDLSDSEVSELSDTIFGTSYLVTSTKSFSSSSKPNLSDLDYSENGETITLEVIGSPGSSSEEVVSQTLDGETSYGLSWDDSHTDFRVRAELETDDPETTPDLTSITLSG